MPAAKPPTPAPVGPPRQPPTCRYCGGGLSGGDRRAIEHAEDCGNPVVTNRRARAAERDAEAEA
jgi:hypothetical protein